MAGTFAPIGGLSSRVPTAACLVDASESLQSGALLPVAAEINKSRETQK
jgi:hypothetical protein